MIRFFVVSFIAFMLAPKVLHGQDTTRVKPLVQVSGVVIDAITEEIISNAQYSISGKGGGVTDAFGQFLLFARQGDSVEFRMVGYKSSVLTLDESIIAASYITLIAMVTDTLQIGEIIIFPQLASLRTIANSSTILDSKEYENARNNIALGVHQGLTGQSRLGDPATNYAVLLEKHKIEAYEKGGIPSDKMVTLSPFMIIPAYYLLMNGLPDPPRAPKAGISNQDLTKLRNAYRDKIFKQK